MFIISYRTCTQHHIDQLAVHLSFHSIPHRPGSPANGDAAVLEGTSPQERSGGQPVEQGRNRTSTPEKLVSLAPLLPLLAQLKNDAKDSFELEEVGQPLHHVSYNLLLGATVRSTPSIIATGKYYIYCLLGV